MVSSSERINTCNEKYFLARFGEAPENQPLSHSLCPSELQSPVFLKDLRTISWLKQEDLYFTLLGHMEPEAFGSSYQNLGKIYNLGDLAIK